MTTFSTPFLKKSTGKEIEVLEEISSGSPTTHSELSLPDYKAFYIDNDHFKEKSSGSTTTYSDSSFSKYDSFIFDLSINSYHPSNRSDFHEEFTDELAQIISQPEYDCFFKDEPELGNFTMDVVGNIFQTKEPRVHVLNVLPTLELDFIPSSESIFAYVVWIFLPFLFIPVIPPYLLSCGDEDTIFDPGISKCFVLLCKIAYLFHYPCFAGELILPKSIPPEIEEVEFDPEGDILFLESLLYDNSSPRPPEALQANSNAIESLPPSHIPVADNDSLMEEIDLFLADDGSIPPGIESDDVDSVDDDTSISLPEFESFYVDYPNSGNSTIDVVEDIPVDVPNVLPTHPILEQDFIPTSEFFAYVVWIFLPFLFIPVIPPYLLSCGDEDTIFDPGISKDCPDCEDSQFCHSSRVSHPQLHLGIRYPNLID
ncbi:hypothetical protein Tco_0513395 [Tanacetum coccineum]